MMNGWIKEVLFFLNLGPEGGGRPVWLLLLCLPACQQAVIPTAEQKAIFVKLSLSDTVLTAGESCRITAHGADLPLDSNWYLVWSGTFGDYLQPGYPQGDHIDFPVPEPHFRRAGYIELSLVRAANILDQTQLRILPGPSQAVMESYAGNKTMVAGSRQKAMVIAIPKDTFGNPVATGTPVQYQLRYPGKGKEIRQQTVDQMVSGIELTAGDHTGKIIIGASSGAARALEEMVSLTPAWPARFTLEAEDWFPYADSRQNLVLYTGFIRDGNGNLVADGTAVIFVVYEYEQLIARYETFTSGGSARVHIENPPRSTTWEVYALVEGKIRSEVLEFNFEPYLITLPFHYDEEQHAVIAGPMTANLGQMVTDDLPLEVRLQTEDSIYYFDGLTENGYAAVSLPAGLPAGNYTCRITAGGLTAEQELYLNPKKK